MGDRTSPTGPDLGHGVAAPDCRENTAGEGACAAPTGRAHTVEFPLPCPFEDLFPAVACQRLPFILDSSLAEGRLGRWSFVGFDPLLLLTTRGRRATIESRNGRESRRETAFASLRDLLGRCSFERLPTGPPFIGGAVGYLGYDLKNDLERLPDTVTHDIPLPAMTFGFYESVLALEHASGRCVLSVCDLESRSARGRARHEADWHARWQALTEDAQRHPQAPLAIAPLPHDGGPRGRLRSTFTRADYLAAVRRTIDYIAAGDIFQANISQRFAMPFSGDPFRLYQRLRRTNASPFGAYLGYPFGAVLSSSPERFLKVVDRHVETRPIKGTRPRTGDEAIDRRSKKELLDSAKDNAELTMIVDLERNDLGRVCRYGTVRVTEKSVLEAYARVYHLVATVEGHLHERHDLVDLLKATFPGGSITGAPKIRAMEIIDELEPTARSVYTGTLGYIGVDGTCDLNIVIRTILVAGGMASVQVGGGIVADSEPEAEYQETLDKGHALFAALGSNVGNGA